MEFTEEPDVKIVLLNLSTIEVKNHNFLSIAGDATNMKAFRDEEFDVVFSNSVIEHVGDNEQQSRMANEMKRVGKRYFVQTPNRNFPVEPHFLFPYFQFLPLRYKVFLVRNFKMGWYPKILNEQNAMETIGSICLLTERELKELFPEATIYKEKFLGLTKSFMVFGGWDLSCNRR